MEQVIKFRLIYNGDVFAYERLTENGWEWMVLELNPDKGEIWNKGTIQDSHKLIREQFTTKTDKHGKEIYCGDLISLEKVASLYKNCPITIIANVVFIGGKYEAVTKKVINAAFLNKGSIHFGIKPMDWIHLPEFSKSEIIGNIHQNSK